MLAGLGDATPAEAALRHSHPEWVARAAGGSSSGPTRRVALMSADNEPAESAARANTLRAIA